MIKQAVATRLSKNDFERCLERNFSERCPKSCHIVPFVQEGGIGRAYQLFGDALTSLVGVLNETLAE